MREIKFRAWDAKGKCYIHVAYIDLNNGMAYGLPINICESMDEAGVPIDQVKQYTGLKDRNGREIYEGDFIKAGNDVMQVVWSEKHASFGLGKAEWAFMHFFAEAVEAHRSEVIGNIHENPELLK